MRYLLAALCMCLAACGAESPAPSTTDASTTDAGTDGPCPSGHYRIGGACVSGTDSNCNGVACSRGTFCTLISTDGAITLACDPSP